MKKLFFTLCLSAFLLEVSPVRAQVPRRARVGFRSGVNFALFTGDHEYDLEELEEATTLEGLPLIDAKPVIRYTGGAYVNIPLSEKYSIQPELNYSRKGSRWRESGTDNNMEWDYRAIYSLDYIEIPFLLKQKVSDDGYGYFGPQMGIITRAQLEIDWEVREYGEIIYEASQRRNILDHMNKLDFSLVAGGSLEFGHLVLDGRFIYSLISIEDRKLGDVRNFVLATTAGLKF